MDLRPDNLLDWHQSAPDESEKLGYWQKAKRITLARATDIKNAIGKMPRGVYPAAAGIATYAGMAWAEKFDTFQIFENGEFLLSTDAALYVPALVATSIWILELAIRNKDNVTMTKVLKYINMLYFAVLLCVSGMAVSHHTSYNSGFMDGRERPVGWDLLQALSEPENPDDVYYMEGFNRSRGPLLVQKSLAEQAEDIRLTEIDHQRKREAIKGMGIENIKKELAQAEEDMFQRRVVYDNKGGSDFIFVLNPIASRKVKLFESVLAEMNEFN